MSCFCLDSVAECAEVVKSVVSNIQLHLVSVCASKLVQTCSYCGTDTLVPLCYSQDEQTVLVIALEVPLCECLVFLSFIFLRQRSKVPRKAAALSLADPSVGISSFSDSEDKTGCWTYRTGGTQLCSLYTWFRDKNKVSG